MRPPRLLVPSFEAALIILLGAAGCSDEDDGSGTSATTPDPPTGTTGQDTDTEAGATSTSSGDETCTDSAMCGTGLFCAAHHNAGQTTAPEQGVCMDSCVPLEHVSLWCIDDAACCEGRCEETSGFCIAEDGTGSSTVTDTGTTDTVSATESGTETITTAATTSGATSTGTTTP